MTPLSSTNRPEDPIPTVACAAVVPLDPGSVMTNCPGSTMVLPKKVDPHIPATAVGGACAGTPLPPTEGSVNCWILLKFTVPPLALTATLPYAVSVAGFQVDGTCAAPAAGFISAAGIVTN